MRHREILLAWALTLAALMVAGCRGPGAPRKEEGMALRPEAPASEFLNRIQVAERIKRNINNLATLSANIRMLSAYWREPGTRREESFRSLPLLAEMNGFLALERPPIGTRMVRFLADFPGSAAGISMLGIGEDFWITVLNPEPGAPRRIIYKGTLDRTSPRPEVYFSLRPQDIIDLLLYDELFLDPERDKSLEYMEVWPNHYILTILRAERLNMIYSRIWVDRRTLQVTHHQLFDADGSILAEARFWDYDEYPTADKRKLETLPAEMRKVAIPRRMLFLWPRENLALEVKLTGVKVNAEIKPTFFKVPETQGATEITIPARMPRLETEGWLPPGGK